MRLAALPFLLILLASCHKEERITVRSFREISAPVGGDLSSVTMSDSLNGVAVGGTPWESGFILSTRDGGQTWQVDTLLGCRMESAGFDRTGQGYVCGQNFAFCRPPGSTRWDVFCVNYAWNKACCFPDDRHGAVVTGGSYRSGQILTFGTDAFWRLDTTYETVNALADVCFSDSATAHAVGMGWVLRSADAGASWQRLDVTGDFFRSVQFPDAHTGYICGSSGTLLKTTDGGKTWQEIRSGGSTGKRNKPFRALWFVSADTGYLVGSDGLFWQTLNGGADWQQIEQAPGDADFTDVFALGDRGWAVAEGGRIFYFEQ